MKPELRLMAYGYGRCPSCGRTGFLWATEPRAKVKRCRACMEHERGKPHEGETSNQR